MKDEQEKLKENFDVVGRIFYNGNFVLAETKTRSLIKKYSKVPVLYNLLGMCLSAQNKTEEAIKSYEKAISLNPKFAIAYNNLGNIYRNKKQDLEMAKELFEKSIFHEPKFALAYNNLGNLMKDLNNFQQAEQNFKEAISCDPKNYVIYTNLGITYNILGEFDKAKECFENSIKINPHFMLAHRNLSALIKYSEKNSHLLQMEKINLEKNIPENEKIDLYMALGKANEDLKNYEKSFNFYLLGNTLKRKIVKYNINDDLKLFKQIKETFNKKLFDQLNFAGNNDDIAPIFIVGMPRSGTSLVEQILATHPKIHGAGELTEFGKQINKIFSKNKKFIFPKEPKNWNSKNLEIIAQEYIKYLKKISGKHKYITDKLPHNFQWIGFIKILFPKSKIIHCTRDKYDNCLSIFKNFFAGNLKFCYDLKELAQHYKGYVDLMEHWQREMPGFIYNISYEELIKNQEKEIKNLINFIGLNWDPICLKFYENKRPVHTVSLSQVRKPIYKDSLKSWEKFRKGMLPLIKEFGS